MSSPLQLARLSPKNRQKSLNFMQWIKNMLKKTSIEIISQFTSLGKSTFVSALHKRLDEGNIKMFHAIAVNLKNSVQEVWRHYNYLTVRPQFRVFSVHVLECSRSSGALVYFVATKHFRKIKNYSSLNQMSALKMFYPCQIKLKLK